MPVFDINEQAMDALHQIETEQKPPSQMHFTETASQLDLAKLQSQADKDLSLAGGATQKVFMSKQQQPLAKYAGSKAAQGNTLANFVVSQNHRKDD